MGRPNARRLALLGILTAVLLGSQVALAALPNVEIVSLLVILYSLLLGRQALLIIYGFVLLEGFLYGFGLWWFSYLYVWTLLAGIALSLRRVEAPALFWAIVSGFFRPWFRCPVRPAVSGHRRHSRRGQLLGGGTGV